MISFALRRKEARSVHGEDWRTAIITEHQDIARELSTPAFLPTTFEEEDEEIEASDDPSKAGAKASACAAIVQADGGDARSWGVRRHRDR